MIPLKRLVATVVLLLTVSMNLLAQQAASQEIEMADRLREDGKIWVVVGVIALIFAGIVLYLVRLDSKISKLEKKIH
ncbi:CcmD family protein [Telluribacter sp. SYSU D00476]|uniref:CcmD family protein n=1 Tax=Telluribacter sp. SYSU D00476 TaxID=2811430 RepID=UPI0021D47072|nr:CcmD family protein [Telluribacter sp. SYSU D00476]